MWCCYPSWLDKVAGSWLCARATALAWPCAHPYHHRSLRVRRTRPCADGDAPRASQAPSGGAEACQRTQFLRDNPQLLQKFSTDLLPLMIKVQPAGRRISWGVRMDGGFI